MTDDGMARVRTLDELARRVREREGLFVRWSKGPRFDLHGPAGSADELTGAPMPGLSVSPLHIEHWWPGSVRLWVARRLWDYSHLQHEKAPGVAPWLLHAREIARGPDNEPLVDRVEPLAWIADEVIAEARHELGRQPRSWGPLRRP
ncbi:DUF6098 family protein [Streptomyces hoynatensis]|uniref:Uncharacterized protein n=1 Tax=Streptomyces hoynatensis TaxID=1141874 RepID=A0A3A9ZBY1_9ACTN|nr:DUF6098 family protein [Streptomyces hoynatensis]RKN45619.1 hypothetical protein D7294_03860 [Streptomyces hoynatensis]